MKKMSKMDAYRWLTQPGIKAILFKKGTEKDASHKQENGGEIKYDIFRHSSRS